ncbi:MAG: tRNA(Ile)-lysidine synthase [Candidatus Acidoferrum typicum]|nr:tRNA(Ile)-lysidine synthase [Candidatus Acidoferrum typicum]
MGSLFSRVRDAIKTRELLCAGERVGVAVSGGADSVALLLLLIDLRKQLGVVFSVAHFNHKLRGKDSDKDERFVAKLAAKYGLVFHSEQLDVAAKAKRDKANLEDTARRARYGFFEALVQNGHVDKVVVAHTADDQAETVLAHILRGTGLAGLGGIHPEVGHVVRPLLCVRRAELRAYLRLKKQRWCEDATNRDTTRMRARIRKKLMPLLEKQFQPAVVQHLATLAELAREDEAFLDAWATSRLREHVDLKSGWARISVAELLECGKTNGCTTETAGGVDKRNLGMARRIVRRIVKHVRPSGGQLNAEHVRVILELAASGQNGKSLELPGGLRVRREHDALVFGVASNLAESKQRKPLEFERVIKMDGLEGGVHVPEISCVFRFRVIDWPAKRGDTIDTGFVLDCDALQSPLMLRNWRPGDKFRPCGHRSEHKLKRLLSRKNVSRWERDGWPVLTSGGTLVWTRGFPVAAEFAVTEKTRTALVITEEPIQ